MKYPSKTNRITRATATSLLGVRRYIKDPTIIANYPNHLPRAVDADGPVVMGWQIDAMYDVTPPISSPQRKLRQGLIYCAHCAAKGRPASNHWRGFVIKFDDGTKVTIGKDCAREQFGADFDTKQREFHTEANKILTFEQYNRVRNFVPAALAQTIEMESVARQFSWICSQFQRRMPAAHRLLVNVVGSGGALVVRRQVTRSFLTGDAQDDRAGSMMFQTLGHVQGSRLFATASPPARVIETARAHLESLLRLPDLDAMSVDFPYRKVRAALADVQEACRMIEDAATTLRSPMAFFDAANLSMVIAVLNNQDGAEVYHRVGTTLVYRPDDIDDEVIGIPKRYKVPKLDAVSRLAMSFRR